MDVATEGNGTECSGGGDPMEPNGDEGGIQIVSSPVILGYEVVLVVRIALWLLFAALLASSLIIYNSDGFETPQSYIVQVAIAAGLIAVVVADRIARGWQLSSMPIEINDNGIGFPSTSLDRIMGREVFVEFRDLATVTVRAEGRDPRSGRKLSRLVLASRDSREYLSAPKYDEEIASVVERISDRRAREDARR